jgi:DNA-binding transcriptional regulator YiaG
MTKKPATRHRDAVEALAAIPDATERARAAGEMTEAMRETTPEVARIRQQAIKELRAQKLSYRAIGDLLGIHFTRVKQLETGESTGKWKKATTQPTEDTPAAD